MAATLPLTFRLAVARFRGATHNGSIAHQFNGAEPEWTPVGAFSETAVYQASFQCTLEDAVAKVRSMVDAAARMCRMQVHRMEVLREEQPANLPAHG